MCKKCTVPVMVGLLACGAVTFMAWMSGYDFTRGASGLLWSFSAVVAFAAGLGIASHELEQGP